jgi:hypothetical protein
MDRLYQNHRNSLLGTYGSCRLHPGRAQIVPKGNPIFSREVMQQLLKTKEDLKGWKVKGNVQLLPGEVRQLRDYLVGSGTLENFQIYVMILLGIKLFLRADELIKMKRGGLC